MSFDRKVYDCGRLLACCWALADAKALLPLDGVLVARALRKAALPCPPWARLTDEGAAAALKEATDWWLLLAMPGGREARPVLSAASAASELADLGVSGGQGAAWGVSIQRAIREG